MAITVGDNEGGGGIAPIGTAGSVCAISPSDLVGTVDNLITRIERIEQILMQIASANVWANQLSDLSQQVGWLGGITYMGVPGWTQTEYGTLIPPPGFTLLGNGITLSDGNTYSAVVMDENGVLQFGFTPIGAVEGEKPAEWDAAAAAIGPADYANAEYNSGDVRWNADSRGITVATGEGPLPASRRATFTVSQSGLYFIAGSATDFISGGSDASQDSVGIEANGLTHYNIFSSTGVPYVSGAVQWVVTLAAGASVIVQNTSWFVNTANFSTARLHASIIRISA